MSASSLRSRDTLIALVAILFLGWFVMKFHMDTANDSETQAYVGSLIASATHATVSTDATGHYAALAPYVMWPFTANLQLVTAAYLIRGLVFALLTLGVALFALAYLWWRRLSLNHVTCLVGLVVLSTSTAFAMQVRGWEIDKLLEPILFLLAALAASHRNWLAFVAIGALAAANRETGIFLPFAAILGARTVRGFVRLPAFWLSLLVCVVEVVWFRHLVPPPTVTAWADLSPERLVYVAGGLCLVPILAIASWPALTPSQRWLLYVIVPMWIAGLLAADRLEQGALLLAPLALVWLPATLLGADHLLRAQQRSVQAPEAPVAPR